MSKRLAILAVSTALATLSVPVAAQDIGNAEHYADVAAAAMRGGQAVEGWVDEADAGADYVEAVTEEPSYDYERREVVQTYDDAGYDAGYDAGDDVAPDQEWSQANSRHHGGNRRGGHHAMASQAPRLAYGPAERAEWLSQCRALHAQPAQADYYYEDEDDHEGLIGGLLGAVVGGVIGNRVNDGDRLLGTVIGAGAGGLAGAVIGSVIDGLGDDEDERPVYADEEPGFDYCEAYLLNYERGYGTPTQVAYAPVMMVPAQHHQVQQRRYRVIEEEVEVAAPARQHRARRMAPRREPGKLERLN